jgi:hypothetical protein
LFFVKPDGCDFGPGCLTELTDAQI